MKIVKSTTNKIRRALTIGKLRTTVSVSTVTDNTIRQLADNERAHSELMAAALLAYAQAQDLQPATAADALRKLKSAGGLGTSLAVELSVAYLAGVRTTYERP